MAIQIIPRLPSTSDRFFEALGQGAETGLNYYNANHQKQLQDEKLKKEKQQATEFIKQITGKDTSDAPFEFQKEFLSKFLQGQNESEKQKSKYAAQLGMIKELGLDFGTGEQGQPSQLQEEPNPGLEDKNISSPKNEMKVKIPSLYPQEKINQMALINPAVSDKMQKHNDNLISEGRHQENLFQKEREFQQRLKEKSPEYQRETALTEAQAKSDIDYNKQLQSAASQHEIKTQTLDKLEKLNNKGVTGKAYEKLLEKFGLVNLTSEGRREFAADVKNLITDIRSILGGQFSSFEFQTILNAYPSADFSQEANRAIINNLKEFQDLRHKEFEIANQIKKENGGKIPADFQSLVNEKLSEYVQNRLPDIKANTRKIMHEEYGIKPGFMLMFDPQGEPLSVPENMIDQYESLGATLP